MILFSKAHATPELLEKCIQEICVSADKQGNLGEDLDALTLLMSPEKKAQLTTEFRDAVDPVIKTLSESEVNYRNSILQAVDFVQKSKLNKLEYQTNRFLNAIRFLILSGVAVPADQTISLNLIKNPEKLLQAMAALPIRIDTEEARRQHLSETQANYILQNAQIFQRRPYRLLARGWFRSLDGEQGDITFAFNSFLFANGFGSSLSEAYNAYLNSLDQQYAELGLFLNADVVSELAQLRYFVREMIFFRSAQKLDRLSSFKLIELGHLLGFFLDVAKGQFPKFDSSFELPAVDLLAIQQKAISQNAKFKQFVRDPSQFDINAERELQPYLINSLILPQDDKLYPQLIDWIEQVRAKVLDFVRREWKDSPIALLAAEQAVLMARFKTPDLQDDYKKAFIDQLSQLKEQSATHPWESHSVDLAWLRIYSFVLTGDVDSLLDLKEGPLANLGPAQFLSDRAMTTHGKIYLSPQVLGRYQFAKHVIAHELGHLVSTALNDVRDQNDQHFFEGQVRQCLNIRHINSEASRTEEDWADWFATTLFKGERGFCYLQVKPSYYENAGLSFDLNSRPDDSHSSEAFRIIYDAINGGDKLGESCLQSLSQWNKNYKTATCPENVNMGSELQKSQ